MIIACDKNTNIILNLQRNKIFLHFIFYFIVWASLCEIYLRQKFIVIKKGKESHNTLTLYLCEEITLWYCSPGSSQKYSKPNTE